MADKMMRVAGRTSGGTAVPMLADNSGNIGTTRAWKRKWVTIEENIEIRDTNGHNLTALDVRDISMVSLRILNRLGVPVTISFLTDVNTANGYGLMDADSSPKNSVTISPLNGYVILTPEDIPLLNYVQYIRISVKAQSVPESGQFSAYAVEIV